MHLVFAMWKQMSMLRLNGSERRSHLTRGGSRDAERLAERRHAAWTAGVQLSYELGETRRHVRRRHVSCRCIVCATHGEMAM